MLAVDSEEHFKWQIYIKTTFVFTCDYTFLHRYLTNDIDKNVFDLWYALLHHDVFKEQNYDLQEEDIIPVKGLFNSPVKANRIHCRGVKNFLIYL